jgi:hypothetical protein
VDVAELIARAALTPHDRRQASADIRALLSTDDWLIDLSTPAERVLQELLVVLEAGATPEDRVNWPRSTGHESGAH